VRGSEFKQFSRTALDAPMPRTPIRLNLAIGVEQNVETAIAAVELILLCSTVPAVQREHVSSSQAH